MLEGIGDCPVQGHGSGLGGPAARAAIGGSLPCRGEGAAPFGGGAGGPDTTRWASTSARPYCATGSAFELSAWPAAATTTMAPGADVERLGRAIRHLLLAVLVDRAATPTTSPTSYPPSSPTPTPLPRPIRSTR
jgi:hypothetical protein